MVTDPTTTAACAFGDPSCPCQDGDVCHYVDDPKSETLAMTPPATAAYEASLDRVGHYLADCADEHDDLVTPCPKHPVTVGDLWTLYCAHREGTHRV